MTAERSISDSLLVALTDDWAPVITLRQRCSAKFHSDQHFLDTVAALITRSLVEPGLHSYSAMSGWRCSYRLTEAGRTRKDRISIPSQRNQEFSFAQ